MGLILTLRVTPNIFWINIIPTTSRSTCLLTSTYYSGGDTNSHQKHTENLNLTCNVAKVVKVFMKQAGGCVNSVNWYA